MITIPLPISTALLQQRFSSGKPFDIDQEKPQNRLEKKEKFNVLVWPGGME